MSTSTPHPLFRLAPLFRPRRGLLVVCVTGLLLSAGLSLIGPWLIGHAVDAYMLTGDLGGVQVSAGIFLGVVLADLALRYASRIGIEVVAQDAMMRLKRLLFDHLIDHDLGFHDQHPSGTLITRVQSDTEALRTLFSEVVLTLPADILLVVGMFVVMAVQVPLIALLVFAVVPAYALMMFWFRRASPPRFLALRAVRARLTGFLSEHLRAMDAVRLFDREAWVRERAEGINREVYEKALPANLLPVYFFNGVFLVRSLGMALVLWVGGLAVANGELTVGALVLGLGYLRVMFNPLMRVSFHLTTLERARAASVRIAALRDAPREIIDGDDAQDWPGLREALTLEDVSFAYPNGAEVLSKITMRIPARSSVGIVGVTGSGKSTLLNLLLRFRDPTSGAVCVDGVDLKAIRIQSLRENMGLVLQDVQLFAGTVLDNLGGDSERAQRALDRLGIDAALDDDVADDGSNLSRGERQLLTFARALVNDPELLVLDEATSAIDPATEARVQAALETLQTGRTTIAVAHRLETVRQCDVIFVLGDGRVIEEGDHGALMARDGVYAALWTLQHGPEAA